MTYGSRLSATVRGGIVMRWRARCGLDRMVRYSGGMLAGPRTAGRTLCGLGWLGRPVWRGWLGRIGFLLLFLI
jgi:hypothetical protein